MKRIFHIISHFDLGGAERVAVNISKSDNKELEYHVVELVRAHGEFSRTFVAELDAAHIYYHRFFIPSIKFHYVFERLAAFVFPFWFIWLFRRYQPQVIHCHTEMPELAVFLFFRLFPSLLQRCSVVRTIHNTTLWTGLDRVGRRVERFMQKQGANIAISLHVARNYMISYGEYPPIIYNGVAEPYEQLCYKQLERDKINILFAGRLEAQKGISTLLEIIKMECDDRRYFFHIIGDGRLRSQVEEVLHECPNARFSPPLYGLSRYMSSFDFLLMPSLHEGLSILSIEAAFCRLPNIINSCDGLVDTLPEDWPLKVYNNDLNAYKRLFDEVLPIIDVDALGARAFDNAQQRFSIQQMQHAYEQIYLNTFH